MRLVRTDACGSLPYRGVLILTFRVGLEGVEDMKNGVFLPLSSPFFTLNIEDFLCPGREVSVPWEEQFCLWGLFIPPEYFFIAAQLFQSW